MSEAFAPLLPANDDAIDPDTDIARLEDSVFQAAAPGEIQDLIDAPCRTLEVEYKSWRNLDHAEDRAELARDIAALANHGGGFIVFGFNEATMLPDETDPFHTHCTAAKVASIVKTYLDPPVPCEVVKAVSSESVIHPVIRVPAHGMTPVCLRQDGPHVGGIKLAERGACYVRKHGAVPFGYPIGVPAPQSVKIELAQDWAPLIRRCARRDREALIGMIDAAIEGRGTAPDLMQKLVTWHRASRTAFLALTPRSPVADSLTRRHYALSYAFELVRPEMLEHAQMPERLRRTVFEVQTQFGSGWHMFDPPYRRGVQARYLTDPGTGDEDTDFLEVAWLRARNPDETADFWRVSPRGFATIIRGYAEDVFQPDSNPPVQPGTVLSPDHLAREVAELVCHARAFARLFGGVRRVAFRCEWWGLANRELLDSEGRWPHRGPALGDHCVSMQQVPIGRLVDGWPELVSQLIAPAIRAVEPGIVMDADWVRRQAPLWAAPSH